MRPGRKNLIEETDWAYFAAIIDGEGTITLKAINFKGRNSNGWYGLVLSVTNCNEDLIDWIVDNFGGFKYCGDKGGNRRPHFIWAINGKNSKDVLEGCLPYLKIKLIHAELALEFLETLSEKGTRIGRIPEEIVLVRDEIFKEFKYYNSRGRQS